MNYFANNKIPAFPSPLGVSFSESSKKFQKAIYKYIPFPHGTSSTRPMSTSQCHIHSYRINRPFPTPDSFISAFPSIAVRTVPSYTFSHSTLYTSAHGVTHQGLYPCRAYAPEAHWSFGRYPLLPGQLLSAGKDHR